MDKDILGAGDKAFLEQLIKSLTAARRYVVWDGLDRNQISRLREHVQCVIDNSEWEHRKRVIGEADASAALLQDADDIPF